MEKLKTMKKINGNKIIIFVCLFFMISLSIISIYSVSSNSLYVKQLIWIVLSIFFYFATRIIGNDRLLKYSYYMYWFMIFMLILVLIIGTEINGTKGWFSLGSFSIQPSEFMKIPLLLLLANIANKFHFKRIKTFRIELKFILRVILVTILPSFLVFVEPDTGAVIIYLLIALTIMLMSNLRKKWFVGITLCIVLILSLLTYLYFCQSEIFINIFGSNMYYRIDRITSWQNGNGMQLENSLIAIAFGGFKGVGVKNTTIYIPEAYSDFIFSIIVNNFGILAGIFLILVIILFDSYLLKTALESSKTVDKYIISTILVVLSFSQIVSIGMTLGVLPIIGISLPFISYGGSSLITYVIMIALVINSIDNFSLRKKIKFTSRRNAF